MLAWLRRRFGGPDVTRIAPRLAATLDTVSTQLRQAGIDHALIGGIAVSVHGYGRATFDLDFLAEKGREQSLHDIMTALGFVTIQRTPIFSNFALGALRVDFLLTQGEQSQAMLSRAKPEKLHRTTVKVVIPEDIIGLKLQALENNPSRTKDTLDIQELIRKRHKSMDMALLREYFVLFGREAELDGILKNI